MSNVRTITGIAGLDKILNGGIPAGRVVTVIGNPGSGKTTLAAQFLYNGVKNYNENGVLVSLEETKQHYYNEMMGFGWNFEELEKEKKFAYIDGSPFRRVPDQTRIGRLVVGGKEFSMLSLIDAVTSNVEALGAKRVVVDPIAALTFMYPDIVEKRRAVLDLVDALVALNTTTLLVTELKSGGAGRSFEMEEYLAHGVIVLQLMQVGASTVRAIQVEKMRQTQIDSEPKPYEITKDGLKVYAGDKVFRG